MEALNKLLLVGGTHGDEFTGVQLLDKWDKQPELIQRNSFNIQTLFANPNAYRDNKRFQDCDLNRQFTHSVLNDKNLNNYEQCRAKVINQEFGPKGNPQTDLIIDIHNTTSNMGPTLVLMQADFFNIKLAAYIKEQMPCVNVLFEDHFRLAEHAFLCSIAKQGIIIEVGPQPQSVLRHDILEQTESMVMHLLDFVDLYNCQTLPNLPDSILAYRYQKTIKYPLDNQGVRMGIVHASLQDKDFTLLPHSAPIFALFNGEEIYWQGDYDAYPHFINEAAYYEENIAMAMAKLVTLTIPSPSE